MTLKNGLPAIHPGEFLRELLEELGSSQADFARAIGVSLGQTPKGSPTESDVCQGPHYPQSVVAIP